MKMNFIKSGIVSLVSLSFLASPVLAVPDFHPGNVVNPKNGQPVATVVVPDTALDAAGTIVPLGSSWHEGKLLEGFAIVHYKKGYHHQPGHSGGPGGGGAKDPAASCYGFLAKGARWKVTEPYVVQGHWEFVDDGTATGTTVFVYDFDTAAVARDLAAWDDNVSFDVFGTQDTFAFADGADTSSPDGKNEVMWGDVSTPGAIAVAIIWGVFSGPTWNRQLVEWDVVFDNVDFTWGDGTVDPTVMDFENIATHEFGHAVGLADLYTTQCSEQTMYGYADYGESKKRTLETGDINGVKALYK